MSRASAHPDLQDALKHEYARAPSILIPDSVRALLPHLARPVPVNSSLWHDWRQAVADSMFFACKTVLSNVPPHLDKLTWRTHGILCALAQDESLLEVVYEYPRKTLKSSVVTVRKPWHRFIRAVVEGRDPSDRYFVLSHGKEKAKRHWWDQKALFDGDGPNQRFFRFLFPELRPSRKSELSTKNEKWNENIGFLERDWNRKNGSFEPLGSREAGAHFDGGFCHAPGTPILHGDSWIPVESHPSFRHTIETQGLAIGLFGLPFEEHVTCDHRYWVTTKHRVYNPTTQTMVWTWERPSWVEARELACSHASSSYIGYEIDYTIEPPHPVPVFDRHHQTHTPQIPPIFHDPEFWWFIGLWWGDGHLGGKKRVYVTFSDEQDYARFEALWKRYGFSTKHRRQMRNCWQSYVSCSWLNAWLRTWYRGLSMKTPPSWVERLDLTLQSHLVAGYIDSDGFVKDDIARITSVHLDGLLVLRRILLRLGVVSTIRAGIDAGTTIIAGRTCNTRKKYDIRFRLDDSSFKQTRLFIQDGFLWSRVRSVETSPSTTFAPIKTRSSRYTTHFGVSHNCDDLIEEENYDEPTAVEKATLYYEFTQNWLEGEHSWLDIVGNRWGLADLNSHLHKTREGTNRVILSVSLETGARRNCEFGCYNLPPYAEELCDILDHTASQFGTIWPEGLPASYIKSSLRGKLRPSVYSAQYLNFPEDADAVEFPISQVHRVKQISLASPIGTALDRGTSHLPVPLHSLNLFVTLDPALDGPSSKNSSAIIVSGMDSSRNVYAIREWVKTRASYTVVLDKFLAFLRLYAGLVHSAGIEEVLFQRVLKDLLRQRASERNIYAPLRPIKTPTSKTKDQRIRAALGTIIEQGRLWVSHDCPQLYDQIRTFGVPGAPRDAIDSLAIAAQIWVPPLSDDETSQIIESDTLAEVERGDTGYGYDLLIS